MSQRNLQAFRYLSGPKPYTCPELVEGNQAQTKALSAALAKPVPSKREPPQRKIELKKISSPSKNKKYPTAQPYTQ